VVLAAWESDAETLADTARRHGMRYVRLRRWHKKLERPADSAAIELAPVLLRPARVAEPSGVLDVLVGPGVVRVPADFDEGHVHRLVTALAAC